MRMSASFGGKPSAGGRQRTNRVFERSKSTDRDYRFPLQTGRQSFHNWKPPPPPDPIYFYHRDDWHYGFTNFSPHVVFYDGMEYPTSEHLFQSFKVSPSSHRMS